MSCQPVRLHRYASLPTEGKRTIFYSLSWAVDQFIPENSSTISSRHLQVSSALLVITSAVTVLWTFEVYLASTTGRAPDIIQDAVLGRLANVAEAMLRKYLQAQKE